MNIKPEIKEKIIATAIGLVTEGVENPTNDQVRERMGGGSLSHISPVMREWRSSRKTELATVLEIPADLKKVIETSISQVWSAANKLASVEIEAVRQEAEETVENVSVERDEALSEIGRLEVHVNDLQKNLSDKEQAITKLLQEREQINKQLNQLSTDNALLAAQMTDREEQLSTFKQEVKEARQANKALQDQLIELVQQVKAKK